jgi:hypothetical protein
MHCYNVIPCSLVDIYQHYQTDCCLLLHPEEGRRFFEKGWYLSTGLNGIISQNTTMLMIFYSYILFIT